MYQSHRYIFGRTQQTGPGFLVPAGAGFPAFDKGFNFRTTSGFVTDGANETYVLNDQYPVTRNAVTFGWLQGSTVQTRDRDSGIDRRLAGICWDEFNLGFRVDLPAAGVYDIHFAAGDPSNASTAGFIIKDDTSTLYTKADTSLAAGHFLDANGTDLSTAAWPGTEAANQFTFSTTTLIVFDSGPGSGAVRPFAHLRIVRVS